MANAEQIIEWNGGRMDFSGGCLVMGILNVTPDSFSDGGEFFSVEKAVRRGVQMVHQGAAIIDVGAESTRPGSDRVCVEEQKRRALPVIEGLSKKIVTPISIDTDNSEVASAAIEAGASMINDISALGDERMGTVAADSGVSVVLMHMQGTPATMQTKPEYGDVVAEVLGFLLERAKQAETLGIDKEKIFVDPGIGFGKTTEHNILLLKNISKFVGTGYKVLVGTSRKRFIGVLTGKERASDRVFGTAATVAMCAAAGVSIVRVHDVAAMVDVVKIANEMR